MRRPAILFLTMFFVVSFFLIGCSRVRTYTVVKDREDQNLVCGNQGYLMGEPKESAALQGRRMTRKTYVAEVEIGSLPSKKEKGKAELEPQEESLMMETMEEPAMEEEDFREEEVIEQPPVFTSYTVKSSDTLQKISMKQYGTTLKWKKIYEANKDRLKSPDKIYAGQVLRIPQE